MEQNRIRDCSVTPAGMSLSQDRDRYYPVSFLFFFPLFGVCWLWISTAWKPFAPFWAVRGIPIAMAAVSQWGEVTRAETGYDTGSMRGGGGDLGQPLCVCSSHHCKPCQQYWLCVTLVICVFVCVCEHRFCSLRSGLCIFSWFWYTETHHIYLLANTYAKHTQEE